MRPPLRLLPSYSYADMLAAYLDCRRRKRSTRSAVAFEANFEARLGRLADAVNAGTYRIGRSQVFVVTRPKAREVWAAGFQDRIVHHLVYRDIAPWYEAGFIEDSFSCIKGRGTQAAIRRVESHARKATAGWTRRAWCLQMDVANFFVSIRKDILWDILRADVGETSRTATLIKQIVFHDCTIGAFCSTPRLVPLVPHHKSLWHCPDKCGLPIGNLTSQFFSNVYLDGLDKFIKHTLRAKFYARYVDDIAILSSDRAQLEAWAAEIDAWLRANRGLFFHPHKITIKPADAGINFVGGVILPWRTYPRRSTAHSAMLAARRVRDSHAPDALCSAVSYLGITRHMDAYRLRCAVCATATASPLVCAAGDNTKLFYC